MLAISIFRNDRHTQFNLQADDVYLRYGEHSIVEGTRVEHPLLLGLQFDVKVTRESNNAHVEIANHGGTLLLETGRRVNEGATTNLPLPTRISSGDVELVIDDLARYSIDTHELDTIERARTNDDQPVVALDKLGKPPGAATISRWLEALGTLQKSAASSPEFFIDAARSVTNPGGLDMGLVLQRGEDDWTIAASHLVNRELGVNFRADIVARVAEEKRTFFHCAAAADADVTSLPQTAVVASPVFDRHNEVVGVVYGTRSIHRLNTRRGIRPLEAQWVQLLAESVSAGISRLDAEADAVRTRVLLEQAFPPDVARELEHTPDALKSEEREVSLLFVDIRRSTQFATQLHPTILNDVFTDALELLTAQVLENDGVIIDYAGDGLAAMWNAPTYQPDHAAQATKAGMRMLAALPAFNDKWQVVLPMPLEVGIGVHTGKVIVGNTGSHRRVKYGPRGPAVALACRTESSTKRLGVPMAITKETRDQLSADATTRRICNARFAGFDSEVEVYEVCALASEQLDEDRRRWIAQYERTLDAIEAGRLSEACASLVELNDCSKCTNSLVDELIARVENLIRQQSMIHQLDPDACHACVVFDFRVT